MVTASVLTALPSIAVNVIRDLKVRNLTLDKPSQFNFKSSKQFCNFVLIFILGHICEIDINECEPNPCVEANECKNLAGDYQCECNAG